MTTEIDLATVKALIDRALALKEQTHQLSRQLSELQTERNSLIEQLTAKESLLQTQHNEFSQQLAQKESQRQQDLAQLTEAHAATVNDIQRQSAEALEEQGKTLRAQQTALQQEHEAALSAITNELTDKNNELSEALTHSEHQNRALINRIKGVEL